jgi:hypothetical protein
MGMDRLDTWNWSLPHIIVDKEKSQYLPVKENWHEIGEETQEV